MSWGECATLRDSVPYVKVHRYNPKHLYPKLNGYGDNGERDKCSLLSVPRTVPVSGYGYEVHWSQKRHNSQNRLQIRN